MVALFEQVRHVVLQGKQVFTEKNILLGQVKQVVEVVWQVAHGAEQVLH